VRENTHRASDQDREHRDKIKFHCCLLLLGSTIAAKYLELDLWNFTRFHQTSLIWYRAKITVSYALLHLSLSLTHTHMLLLILLDIRFPGVYGGKPKFCILPYINIDRFLSIDVLFDYKPI
jgi:hypothetical protein